MDSQHIALWSCSFLYLHLRKIMNPPFHPPAVCPSANLSSLHLPHTKTHQWGTRFCILYIFPTFIHYLLYRCLYFPSFNFVVTIGDLLSFWPHATHVTLGWIITSHFTPVGIVYIFRVLPRSLTFILWIYSPCPASGTTYPWSCRPPDTRSCHTVAATPSIMHPPTKGSLESSHFLTSSMYLCHFLTIVDSVKPFASGSHVPLLSTSAHFFERATVSWFSFFYQWEISDGIGGNTIAPWCRWPP